MVAGYPGGATCASLPGSRGRTRSSFPLEVSALTHAGAAGTHARSPLLRLQSDERLIALIRRGNHSAFEALVARYQSRLLAFCRHMLSSREDAEDVLQEVFAAAFKAILADRREINVRPWLYRIARNRSLNHLRKAQAIGVDSMDVHLSEHGLTTADKVHKREEFRQLMSDVQELPETQRTALLLREIDALSYAQIAEAMETTIPSVKSLLVRARVSLAEAAEARLLSCEEVREELGEVAEGLRRTTAPVRRHLRSCDRCQLFRKQLRQTNRALAAIFPIGPLLLLKKALVAHAGTAVAGSGGAAAGSAAAGGAGLLQAGAGALVSKAAAGLAAAAIVTAGAVEVKHVKDRAGKQAGSGQTAKAASKALAAAAPPVLIASVPQPVSEPAAAAVEERPAAKVKREAPAKPAAKPVAKPTAAPIAAAAPSATPEPLAITAPPPESQFEQREGDTIALPGEPPVPTGSAPQPSASPPPPAPSPAPATVPAASVPTAPSAPGAMSTPEVSGAPPPANPAAAAEPASPSPAIPPPE